MSNQQVAITDYNGQPGGSSRIYVELEQAILTGEYKLNERLPAERTLAQRFGCSRGTIRAAMMRLEQNKLIERRVGSGTFITHKRITAEHRAAESEIATITSPLELIEVRRGLEPRIARLAVINASAVWIDKLEHALNQLESLSPEGTPEAFTLADQTFHLALAECSGNSLMLWLYKHINDVRSHRQWSAMKDKILVPEQIKKYNDQHRQIFEAIVSRDADAAVQHSIDHLALARSDLIGASG